MPVLRTRFKKEIVAEFLQPKEESNKVLILCGGMPTYPGRRDELLEFVSLKGYWVFTPRYRGTWESGGSFLKKSPHIDVIDVIDQLSKGFTDCWNKKEYKIKDPEIYLIGSSFGGPAVLLASIDPRVKKVVALSPVIDWQVESKIEPLDWLFTFTKDAFGEGYRGSKNDWNKLKKGNFYNPVAAAKHISGEKVKMFHCEDDEVVPYMPTSLFAEQIGARLTTFGEGGHLSISQIKEAFFWKRITSFFNK